MSETKSIFYYTSIALDDLKIPKENTAANSLYKALNSSGASETWLTGLARINCLVGPNNSGKSRLLRTLFFNVTYKCNIEKFDFDAIQTATSWFEQEVTRIIKTYGTIKPNLNGNIFSLFRPHEKILDLLTRRTLQKGDFSFFQGVKEDLLRQSEDRNLTEKIERLLTSYVKIGGLAADVSKLMKQFANEIQEIEKKQPSYLTCPQSHIYIPILRTLRGTESEVRFGRTTMLDYFQEKDEAANSIGKDRTVFDGTDIHKEMVNLLLLSSAGRKKILEYEKFLSDEFFDGKNVQLSPNHYDKTIHITIGDVELPAHQLGDGMQTILLLTFPAFFADETKMIFAEEPEVYLHPGMQRRLIEVIISNTNLNRHQWFFTTHSNHLIDMTLDYSHVSVFHCQKIEDKTFLVTRMTSPDLNLLAQLGVMASSVFRTNATIWLEGITDRRYLRVFISRYLGEDDAGRKMREDIHYSFVELGGGNMVHFDFFGRKKDEMNVKRIAGNSFIIIDGDNSKGTRIEDITDNVAEENRYILQQKEIENILPEVIVRECVSILVRDSDLKNKKEILKNVSGILYSEYSLPNIGLGEYIDKKLAVIENGNEKGYFKAASGTITNKVKFCDIAVNLMTLGNISWSISDDASIPIKKICNFIVGHNK